MLPWVRTLVLFGLLLCQQGIATTPEYNRDIRPILSENCFHCHGPDEAARQTDLRLDTEDGAYEFAVVPGDIDASELFARVSSTDPEYVMPPPGSERSLTADQIALLREWIARGATYQPHWSFIAPTKSTVPVSGDDLALLAPIDQFIGSRLGEKGLKPALPVDKETLIRRVTLTLTGLPPTLPEIDAYLNDEDEQAYERLVDRLLASPAFGERMAAEWLDVARYSDTYGYQVDRDRFVWPWRDWVVRAFNENMPYDQFITEQLAGDLLPKATRDQILATTFNRLHPQKVEGGSVPEEFRIEYVSDRTQTVATSLMGLTMECCRCHAHKFDPISHREYYQLSAFFDNIDEAGLYSYFTDAVPTPTLTLPTPDQERLLAKQRQLADTALSALANAARERRSAAKKWLGSSYPPQLTFAEPILSLDFETDVDGANELTDGIKGRAVKLTGDDPIHTEVGEFRRFEPFSVSLWIRVPRAMERAVVFHRSRAWTDAGSRGYQLLIEDGRLSWSLIHFWPGNATSIRDSDPVRLDTWIHVAVTNDGSSQASGLHVFVDGQPANTEVVRDALSKTIIGSSDGKGKHITIGERFRDRGFAQGSVDEFRVFDVELSQLEIHRLANRNEVLSWLDSGDYDDRPSELLIDHYLQRQDHRVAACRDTLQSARRACCETEDSITEIMVMRELPSPRVTHRLERGVYDAPAEPVQPDTPSVLPRFPEDAPRSRAGLARWLTDPQHPLTSRVAVNRLWQICFGKGLVPTPEDFGRQGAPPTHPELLDWLAVDYIESGWDTKRMIKQIVMSKTFRQSSRHDDGGQVMQIDSQNKLLASFPVYRLPAEMLRDGALAVSGRLVAKIGGPPVKPYEIEASLTPLPRDHGEGLYRRSVYTYWKRSSPAPAMVTLDAAQRQVCSMRREPTSSPLQALVMLNGPQFVEAARGLAECLIEHHGNNEEAVLRDAYRTLTSRRPGSKAMAILHQLYQRQSDYFQADEQRAKEYLAVGEAPADEAIPAETLAATTAVVNTLMNYDLSVMMR